MAGSDGSVDDALTADHVELDGLFERLRSAVAARDAGSEAVQDAFERRLVRHMSWEEEALFPALRAADARYPDRKIDSLLIDHARIREKLLDLASHLRESQWSDAGRAVEDLWVLLEGHNRDEEKGVYTDADRLIPEADRLRLVGDWRGLR